MRKLGEGAWICFLIVPPLNRNFPHSKLFELSPLKQMACDWASWMKTNRSVVEREILLTVVEELLPKSNTELLVVEKRLNLVVSDSFSSSFHLKPPIYISRIHILQTKSAQISYHGRRKGSNILDRAREGCHRLLSWQIQRTQWAIQVGWVGQFTNPIVLCRYTKNGQWDTPAVTWTILRWNKKTLLDWGLKVSNRIMISNTRA